MGYQDVPLIGCHCIECDAIRAQNQRPTITPFTGILGNASRPLPFEPGRLDFTKAEPGPEPVYTLVLIDCYDDGDMMGDTAEPHTAESLIEAIIARRNREGRFKVYKLGEMILDVTEIE